MTGAFTVKQPGLSTTVQDLGRTGGQRFGIPVSGAADPIALRAANVVVGNAQGTAGLEIVLMGPVLEVQAESVRVAVAGGAASIDVTGADGESRRVPALRRSSAVSTIRNDECRCRSTAVGLWDGIRLAERSTTLAAALCGPPRSLCGRR